MRSNIVDIAGGTFIVTAISYATGIAYYNALFRSLNGKPELFSVSLERILFEGGRQLVYIAYEPMVCIVAISFGVAMLHIVLKALNILWFSQLVQWFTEGDFFKILSRFSWAYLFIFMASVTSYAFLSGKAAGEQYAAQASCVKAKVHTESADYTGCVIYKTDAEVWIAVKEQGVSVLLNIPSDKYLTMRVF